LAISDSTAGLSCYHSKVIWQARKTIATKPVRQTAPSKILSFATTTFFLFIIFMGQSLLTPILVHPQSNSLIAIAACLTTTPLLEILFLMLLGAAVSNVIFRFLKRSL